MNFNELQNRKDFANKINIPLRNLTYMLYKVGVDNLYEAFEIPKKSGGVRKINAPSKQLKDIQKKIALQLENYALSLESYTNNKVAHGFVKGRDIFSNAKIHRNKKLVLNIDIEDFFNSIHFGRVRGYFKKNNFFLLSEEVSLVIAQICCFKGSLPQGAPTSPIISNLICQILDNRIVKIAKKYKLDYTRYADDMTFSTNDMNFIDQNSNFIDIIKIELQKAGFKINEDKTRLQYADSRQTVTGLIVNKKINIPREYYKLTRAMAHNLYKNGVIVLGDKTKTIEYLEGRFAFINQVEKYNNIVLLKATNKKNGEKKKKHIKTSKEIEYQKFLYFKNFYQLNKPLIIMEGKTDILYIKAALKKLYKNYPDLITRNADGTFNYNIKFFKRSKKIKYFFNMSLDGADATQFIYDFYSNSKNQNPTYYEYFEKICSFTPQNPIIIITDNELVVKSKPLSKLLTYVNLKDNENKMNKFKEDLAINLKANLHLATIPLVKNKKECAMEDLFDEDLLRIKLGGKTFSIEHKYDNSKYFGKNHFSKYVYNNYKNINFQRFVKLLDVLNDLVVNEKVSDKVSKIPVNQ